MFNSHDVAYLLNSRFDVEVQNVSEFKEQNDTFYFEANTSDGFLCGSIVKKGIERATDWDYAANVKYGIFHYMIVANPQDAIAA